MVDAESKIKTDVKHKRIRHAYPRKKSISSLDT